MSRRRQGRRRPAAALWAATASMAGAVALGGCASGSGSAGSTVPATTTPGATISTEVTPVGRVLATGSGQTLYAFLPDASTVSRCVSATCTYVWPPLTVTGTPTVAHGARASLVGELRRPDGSTQVSYGGHPLYTYTSDTSPGMVSGQGVNQAGGPWYVVAPDGRLVTTSFSVGS